MKGRALLDCKSNVNLEQSVMCKIESSGLRPSAENLCLGKGKCRRKGKLNLAQHFEDVVSTRGHITCLVANMCS